MQHPREEYLFERKMMLQLAEKAGMEKGIEIGREEGKEIGIEIGRGEDRNANGDNQEDYPLKSGAGRAPRESPRETSQISKIYNRTLL